MRLHEPVRIEWARRLGIHFWANVRMLQQPRVLLLSSVVAIIPTLIFSVLVIAFVGQVDPRRTGSWTWTVGLVAALALWLIGQHLFFVYAMQRWYAPFVRREFSRAGMPMCEHCGHRLPPVRPATCPECGDALSTPQESGPVSG